MRQRQKGSQTKKLPRGKVEMPLLNPPHDKREEPLLKREAPLLEREVPLLEREEPLIGVPLIC